MDYEFVTSYAKDASFCRGKQQEESCEARSLLLTYCSLTRWSAANQLEVKKCITGEAMDVGARRRKQQGGFCEIEILLVYTLTSRILENQFEIACASPAKIIDAGVCPRK